MTQLLIGQSYGKGSGDTISLVHLNDGDPHPKLEQILLSYGCHKEMLLKIRTCLKQSRRYDCEVQPCWFRNQAGELERNLKGIEIELKILRFTRDGERAPKVIGFKGEMP